MRGVNKAIVLGRLGADPTLSYTPSGKGVCNVSLATSEAWGQGDDRKEKTEWHRLVIWGKPGEVVAQYCKKGDPLYVEGKIQTRTWDDDGGNKHYMTEINVFIVELLGEKRDAEPIASNNSTRTEESAAPAEAHTDHLPF